MHPYAAFEFADSAARRKTPVADVLPRNAVFRYAALLWSAELNGIPVRDFAGLQAATATASPFDAITEARASGALVESEPRDPPEAFWEALTMDEATSVHLRLHIPGRDQPILETSPYKYALPAMRARLAEEIEIFPSDSRWYIRFRDDTPLMFLAAHQPLISALAADFPRNVLPISEDFIFAA